MKWVTRKRIHVNRTATAWLIKRFVDPEAEVLFVEPAEVAAVERRDAAIGFDAPGAKYPHKDGNGRCSFEQLAADQSPQDDDPDIVARAAFLYDSLYAHLRRAEEGRR